MKQEAERVHLEKMEAARLAAEKELAAEELKVATKAAALKAMAEAEAEADIEMDDGEDDMGFE